MTGTNDRPLVSNGPQTGNVDEAGVDANNNDIPGTASVSGDLNASDVDNDQSDLSWTLISDQFADFGEFILNSETGEWSFNLFNDSPVVEAMQEGDTPVVLTYNIRVSDDNGSFSDTTVTITVTGTNDRPDAEDDCYEVSEPDAPFNTAYVVDSEKNLLRVNPATGEHEVVVQLNQYMTDIAISPSGVMYGISGSTLYIIDPITGTTTVINDSVPWSNGLTFAPNGDLYASGGDNLYQLNTSDSGQFGDVVATFDTLGANSAGDIVFHQGEMYFTTSLGHLARIDFDSSGNAFATIIKENVTGSTLNFGLTSGHDGLLYIFSDNNIYTFNFDTNTAEFVSSYGQNAAYGAAQQTTLVNGNVLENDTDIENDDLIVTQVQLGDTIVDAGQSIDGIYGTLVLNADGSFTYYLDKSRAVTAGLEEGEVVFENFTYTASDQNGGLDTAILKIKITGTDDLPVISEDAGAVIEDTELLAEGTLTATDADNPDLAFVANTVSDVYGTFTVDDAGNWTYTLNQNATVDALVEDEELIKTFTVSLSDGTETTVTIKIIGTDDLPVVSEGADTVIEDTDLFANGTLTATDADNPNLAFVANTISDIYGTFIVDDAGNWTYTLNQNATVDALVEDEELIKTFTVALSDGTETTVTIKIIGTDDLPVVSEGADTVIEDTDLFANGTLTATDADNPDLAFVANTVSDVYGTFIVDDAGNWTYTLNQNATVDALVEDEELIKTFTVSLSDGTETTVTIKIIGTDDLPVVSEGADTVIEDTDLFANGTLTATDADNPNLAFVANTISDIYGTFIVDDAGNWAYTLNQNVTVDALVEDEELIKTFTVALSDGTETTVTIKIIGTDDLPVVSVGADTVVEDTDLFANGTLTATDADNPDLTFAANTVSDVYGTFSVDGAGNWTYTLNQNATVDGLAKDEEVLKTFTVALSDGTSTTVSITIVGINDEPKISNVEAKSVSEEGLTPDDQDFVGIPDQTGSPEDKSNSAVNTGTFEIEDIDSDELTVSMGESPIFSESGDLLSLTSGQMPITWTWDPNTDTLIGSIGSSANGDYQKVITIALTAPSDAGSNIWTYTVNLEGPIDHPDTTVEDVILGQFELLVSDGNGGTDTATISISFEDDRPAVVNEQTVIVTEQDIPNTLVGNFSLINLTNAYEMDFDGFTISGKGFKSSDDITLVDATLYSDGNGIGVQSVGAPYHPIAGEIDFRTLNGESASEEVIFTLDTNTLAYGVKIEFAAMFGGSEDETGVVEFYRNGELIASVPFTSDTSSGNFAANFEAIEGGFDTMIIKATDNGKNNPNDNSDFTITSVEFIGEPDPVIGYANGELETIWGADGPGEMELLSLTSGELRTIDGQLITTELSGNIIRGVDTNDNVIFEFIFTPATGEWDFLQYEEMQVGGSNSEFEFSINVTDGDGDNTVSTISVTPLVSGFTDDDEVITIVEDSGLTSGNVIDGNSSHSPITVLSFMIAGDVTEYVADGNDVTITDVGIFSLDSNGNYEFTPTENYYGNVPSIVYQMKDANNFTEQSTLNIEVTPTPDPIVITRADSSAVSEEGLQFGTPDESGDSDTTDSVTGVGQINVSNPDGTEISLMLTGPEDITSQGQAVEWLWNAQSNTLVGYVAATNNSASYDVIHLKLTSEPENFDGNWDYEATLLKPIDHDVIDLEDDKNIDVGVHVISANNTEITSSVLSVSVEDDGIEANDIETNIIVDNFAMSGMVANWVAWQGGSNVNTNDGNGDGGRDQIRWGSSSTSSDESGYNFVDNDAGLDGTLEIGEDLLLGTFTHLNNPVYASAIGQATLEITFSVTDSSGNEVDVSVQVVFDHNETGGTPNPADEITILSVTGSFLDGANEYQFSKLDFVDSNGNVVPIGETVFTEEGGSTEFELVAQIDLVNERPSVTGNVADDGNVLGADQGYEVTELLFQGTTYLITGSNITINGIYGDLVINSSGNYTYTLTENAADIPLGQSETFVYTIEDDDGDSTTANFTINLNFADNSQTNLLTESVSNDVVDIEMNVDDFEPVLGQEPSIDSFIDKLISLDDIIETGHSIFEMGNDIQGINTSEIRASEFDTAEFIQEIELKDVNNLTQYVGTQGGDTGMISYQSEFDDQSQLIETNTSDVSRFSSSHGPKELHENDAFRTDELLP
ncbi:VCBS domain-containing protein [Parashewanella hymeniacidonis]|uniref:VCBS domain-containing protein n=1 Tax=Parashewanella hymeniacidonis TaxID=2807618 RepID=UPI0030846C85